MNKLYRKIISIACIFSLIFALTACKETPDTPEQVAELWFNAIQNQDVEQMESYYNGDIKIFIFSSGTIPGMSGLKNDTQAALSDKLSEFTYTLSEPEVSEESATMDVTIKTYSMGQTFASALQETFQKAFDIVGTSESAISDAVSLDTMFKEKIEAASFDYEQTVPVVLTKTKDGWVVENVENSNPLVNAVYGGLIGYSTTVNTDTLVSE